MTEPTWITDRLPTAADGDSDGDVLVRTRPDGDGQSYLHCSFVSAGMAWKHCPGRYRTLLDFRIGQRWRRRDGEIVRVYQTASGDDGCHVRDSAEVRWGYEADGTAPACSNGFDLVELLPDQPVAPTITSTGSELICTFEHLGKTYQAVATPAEPTVREQALRLVADYGVASYRFTAAQVATIRAALEAQP